MFLTLNLLLIKFMKKIIFASFYVLLFLISFNQEAKATEDYELMSVVQIKMNEIDINHQTTIVQTGSGVVLDNSGKILTNLHVLLPSNIPKSSYLVVTVCTISSAKDESLCRYLATLKHYNTEYDLALLQIEQVLTSDSAISGKATPFMDFKMEGYEMPGFAAFSPVIFDKNSYEDVVNIGDDITTLGFPSYGGDSITLTKGTVSGFEIFKDANGDVIRSQDKTITRYVKTDAKVNPGNSGGGAFDENGNFIGIPTLVAGGDGNIGYITPISMINYFLDENNVELSILSKEEKIKYLCESGFEFEGYSSLCLNSSNTDKPIVKQEIPRSNTEEGSFSDIPMSHKNSKAIEYMREKGIINGYQDGTFKPENSVNRAELLKILIESLKLDDFNKDEFDQNCFADVAKCEWYTPYVCYAKEKSWVKGYTDNTFKANQAVSKVEALKIILNAYGFVMPERLNEQPFDDILISEWFAPFIKVAKDKNFLEEKSGNFEPHKGMTRASVSQVIYNVLMHINKE